MVAPWFWLLGSAGCGMFRLSASCCRRDVKQFSSPFHLFLTRRAALSTKLRRTNISIINLWTSPGERVTSGGKTLLCFILTSSGPFRRHHASQTRCIESSFNRNRLSRELVSQSAFLLRPHAIYGVRGHRDGVVQQHPCCLANIL